ncbi:MAG: aspartate kinase [Balneolaceae bacterium]|nr:aspartate kinase [Balneolaceae bacterium]
MKNIRVLKFGGTSMADEHTWLKVIEVIKKYDHPLVVVSATSRTTRQLISAAEAALTDRDLALDISNQIKSRHQTLISNVLDFTPKKEINSIENRCFETIDRHIKDLNLHIDDIYQNQQITPAKKDTVASIGEQLSAALFAECAQLFGLHTRFIDAREIIKTNSEFGNAKPNVDKVAAQAGILTDLIENDMIPIVGGYYGENEEGHLTTLGFEGSDYTASLIGAALDCEAIEIWTDVNGIFTSDPNIVEDAISLPEISFQEATEMAYFGARILHPSTLKPAAEKNKPVFVRNIFNVDHPGTKIHSEAPRNGPVRAVTFSKGIVIITVNAPSTLMGYHFLVDVFEKLEEHHIIVDVVTTTEASISIAVQRPENLQQLTEGLKEIGEVSLIEGQGLISLISFSPSNIESIYNQVFAEIRDIPLSLISFSRDKRNLNIILPERLLIETARTIHRSLFSQQIISD